MATIETRIVRLEQRFPEPDPFDELDHKELKAFRDFLREEISAREQGRRVSREALVALKASGRHWDTWIKRVIQFKKHRYSEWSVTTAEGAK